MSGYLFKLYIMGTSDRSDRAIDNLKRMCDEELSGSYELEIIDVLQNPQAAETDKIVCTPTVVRAKPSPPRRVVGDLADREQVMKTLNIVSVGPASESNLKRR